MAEERKSTVEVKLDGQVLVAVSKVFSTGSRGYYGSGKVMVNGKLHQVSMNVVEIGSKKK